jgi:hypothetical protein
MSEPRGEKGWGKSVLGWFVVSDDDPGKAPAADAESLIAKYAAAPTAGAAAPVAVELKGPVPAVADGKVDFTQVFEAAGIDADERGRVDKARELLRSLPSETPQPVKKQIVEASLRAFGVPTAKIIEAGVAEIQALESVIQKGQADAQGVVADGNKRIADLEKQMGEVRVVMQQAVADQEARTRLANAEKLGIQQVLEFFGRDAVDKVVQESPKLKQT